MTNKKKILIVFGTRPEAIKMAPLVKEFYNDQETFETRVCVTAQHREMLDQVLDFFEIKPDYDLDLMKPNQDLFNLTSNIIAGLKGIFESFSADYTFVHGDTTTTFGASVAAFYAGSRVCHVEAGLRTNNKRSPFPEEMNRQLTSRIADFHFAPTENSKNNLLKENITAHTIFVTGNTVIDALMESVQKVEGNPSNYMEDLSQKLTNNDVLLVTGHRRENHGEGFLEICKALDHISKKYPELIIVYPVHLNPNVQGPVYDILSQNKNILLIEPLNYPDFVWMMNRSKYILTDSGGVQEEAPSLGKPVLVMRDTTERPEAVTAGTVKLVGANFKNITSKIEKLIRDPSYYKTMSGAHNPYGDGNASKRIVNIIKTN